MKTPSYWKYYVGDKKLAQIIYFIPIIVDPSPLFEKVDFFFFFISFSKAFFFFCQKTYFYPEGLKRKMNLPRPLICI